MKQKRAYDRYIPTREVFYTQAAAAREYGVCLMTIWRYANEYKMLNKYIRRVGRGSIKVEYKKSELDALFTPRAPHEMLAITKN